MLFDSPVFACINQVLLLLLPVRCNMACNIPTRMVIAVGDLHQTPTGMVTLPPDFSIFTVRRICIARTMPWQDDVSHCRILSPDKTEWRLISATLCG